MYLIVLIITVGLNYSASRAASHQINFSYYYKLSSSYRDPPLESSNRQRAPRAYQLKRKSSKPLTARDLAYAPAQDTILLQEERTPVR